ncbi:SpoIIE family protein phosphatase (plasmid) [Streptomyces sp. NBC_00445]|uniref:PP2C family protein-serine/threonine phosphatase n=1 Tax=Streptomyces sp. NBC_00445 TaxID=2975745 RepID=UPI002E250753
MTKTAERSADRPTVIVAVAQRPGTEPPCADGVDVQRRGKRVSAVVVDGAGHHEDVVRYAAVTPPVITHTGIALGGLAGLIAAGQMAYAYGTPPHASALYASMEPGWPTSVHWIGDCRAYGWDGQRLTLWSTDMTMGQWLRRNGGVPVEIAEVHDNWSRLGLAQAAPSTCRQVEIPEETALVLLVSDGISDQVATDTMEELCRTRGNNPQALADALVNAAQPDDDGYRDDASVVVLLCRIA